MNSESHGEEREDGLVPYPVLPEIPDSPSSDDGEACFSSPEDIDGELTPFTSLNVTPNTGGGRIGILDFAGSRLRDDGETSTTPTKSSKLADKGKGKAHFLNYELPTSDDASSASGANNEESRLSPASPTRKPNHRYYLRSARVTTDPTPAVEEPDSNSDELPTSSTQIINRPRSQAPDAYSSHSRTNTFQRSLDSLGTSPISLRTLSNIFKDTDTYQNALSKIISFDLDAQESKAIRCAALVQHKGSSRPCKSLITNIKTDHIEQLGDLIEARQMDDEKAAWAVLKTSKRIKTLCHRHRKQVKEYLDDAAAMHGSPQKNMMIVLCWILIIAIQISEANQKKRFEKCLGNLLTQKLEPLGVKFDKSVNIIADTSVEATLAVDDDGKDGDIEDSADDIFLPLESIRQRIFACAILTEDGPLHIQTFSRYQPKNQKNDHRAAIEKKVKKQLGKYDKLDGYVYAFRLYDTTGHIKIGYSNNVSGRLKEWRTKYKCTIELIWQTRLIKNAGRVESLVHDDLREYRRREQKCCTTHHEWFCIDEDVAKQAVRKWAEWMDGGIRYNGSRLVTMSSLEMRTLCTPGIYSPQNMACTQCVI